jgi:hypothetical protein
MEMVPPPPPPPPLVVMLLPPHAATPSDAPATSPSESIILTRFIHPPLACPTRTEAYTSVAAF